MDKWGSWRTSPLLSNLVLDELDRELEARGHRFVRYADDCNIYVRSERAGQRVMESVKRFIANKLKLKVNEAKSAVAKPQERKFLGFSFYFLHEQEGAEASNCAEGTGTVQRASPGDHARKPGTKHEADDRRAVPLYEGMDRLFRLLRNPVGTQKPGLVDQEAAPMRLLAAVEDQPQAVRGTGETRREA